MGIAFVDSISVAGGKFGTISGGVYISISSDLTPFERTGGGVGSLAGRLRCRVERPARGSLDV